MENQLFHRQEVNRSDQTTTKYVWHTADNGYVRPHARTGTYTGNLLSVEQNKHYTIRLRKYKFAETIFVFL
jgi:phenylalanine-4-hydroxylase